MELSERVTVVLVEEVRTIGWKRPKKKQLLERKLSVHRQRDQVRVGAFDQEKVVGGKPRFGGQAIVQGRELERLRVHGHEPMSKSRNSAPKKAHGDTNAQLIARKRQGVEPNSSEEDARVCKNTSDITEARW